MMNDRKISICFFDDREVRAVWDEERANWYFSVIDVVAVLNGENDHPKVRNYWKYLKNKLKKENSQLVSKTNQLRLISTDGKRYLTDTLDADGIIALAKNFSNNKAAGSLDWFFTAKLRLTDKARKGLTLFSKANLLIKTTLVQ